MTPQTIIISLISLYQHTISPDHGLLKKLYPFGYCRYYPSCSEYTKQAYIKHGCMRGSIFAVRRIIKCNPWSKGGMDFVN